MNRRTKVWAGLVIVAGLAVFFGMRILQPKTLQDFERRCDKTADPVARQKIALEAVEFLIQQGVPDSIAEEIRQAAVAEKPKLPSNDDLLVTDGIAMNDSLWAQYESRLAKFLPSIYHLKQSADPAVVQTRLASARNLAEKIDAYTKYDYWAPLLDFLSHADSTNWYLWRAAAISERKSKDAFIISEYKLAKLYSLNGLQSISAIPNRRLYLDLCFRLQNTLAYDEAIFRLAVALGEWVTKECKKARHYLRATSMDYNLADQQMRTGRYDDTIEKLKNVQLLAIRWQSFRDIEWYQRRTLERLAMAMYHIGEYQTALQYLELFGTAATGSTEKALYHIGKGVVVTEAFGDYETAEQEYLKAITAAKGEPKNDKDDDCLNMWYAYMNLGELFWRYNLPEKSLQYFEKGRLSVESRKGFLNHERLSYYLIRLAKAQIQKNEWAKAKETLGKAEQALQSVDSPRARVDKLTNAAALHQSLKEFEETANQLKQAIEICRVQGLFLEELGIILKQAELAAEAQKVVAKPVYPVEALSQVIHQLQKIGDKSQLIRAHALLVDAAYKANAPEEAHHQASLLLEQMEALSRQYDKEERLIFFQHGIYKDVKSAIQLHIMLGHIDSAFMKVSYIKGRALRRRLAEPKTEYLDIVSVQKSLQNNEAIIDYMVTTDTLYAFVLTRSKLQLFRFHESKVKLQASVDEYLRYLTDDSPFQAGNDEKHFRELFLQGVKLSNRLYNKLFEKMAQHFLKMDRLFIIPDEFLYALPFNTLALHETAETRFLIEDKAIMVLPSAWTLVTQPEKKEEFDILASIVPDMHGSQKIAKHIATLFGKRAHIHTKWEGKNSFMTHLAKGYETYLFFAHAEANWDEPRESFIEFPLSMSHLTGQLSYQDIDSLGWRKAALVILAGCETSGSRIYLGAGLAGLQSAFLAAGARQVMATYWKVDAAQVADQISLFLKEWIGRNDAILALQAMQKTFILQMKRDPYFKYPHPHLWGAYNLTGIKLDIGSLIDLAENRSSK